MAPSTTSTGRRPGRPPVRQSEISDWLRHRIVDGRLPPGDRLPSRRALHDQFGASLSTIQSALDLLAQEGFVESRSTSGTFVTEMPPHLTDYVLVFPDRLTTVERNRFWHGLQRAARAYQASGAYRIRLAYIRHDEQTPDRRALEDDITKRRVRGLIFASTPWGFGDSPIVAAADLPRVCIGIQPPSPQTMPSVRNDATLWMRRAVERFASDGRRRIGLVTQPPLLADRESALRRLCAELGLETRPHWSQSVSIDARRCGRRTMELLMALPPSERPDALLIDDDNLVEDAAIGLVTAGVVMPRDLSVIAYCNFPWLPSTAVPVNFLGFDLQTTLDACLSLCRSQEEADSPAASITIAPLFQDERQCVPAAAPPPMTP